ncbi:hypothetical protein [Aeromicrobium sp. 179-A 4D2 NHS]|uniref:hypothetical protein n=1 Tax=Aeromicrobium sp. 179-A 4D2 NHS TaxID=3142375 RepID=UPI0039A3BD4F
MTRLMIGSGVSAIEVDFPDDASATSFAERMAERFAEQKAIWISTATTSDEEDVPASILIRVPPSALVSFELDALPPEGLVGRLTELEGGGRPPAGAA